MPVLSRMKKMFVKSSADFIVSLIGCVFYAVGLDSKRYINQYFLPLSACLPGANRYISVSKRYSAYSFVLPPARMSAIIAA